MNPRIFHSQASKPGVSAKHGQQSVVVAPGPAPRWGVAVAFRAILMHTYHHAYAPGVAVPPDPAPLLEVCLLPIGTLSYLFSVSLDRAFYMELSYLIAFDKDITVLVR